MPLLPRPHHAILAAFSLALIAGTSQAADLTVEVSGAKSTQGTVSAALYGSADTWLKEPQKLQGARAPAAQPVTVLVFRNLPPGRYALSAFHDENGNEKVDTNVVGMPTEPTGFSRDARGRMGPAAFDDAVIDVQGDMTTAITLR
ncbi:MAG: DUF2141 domain-containing protein [Rhodocyclaceae bacterium]|nr:DUF2141 domain-containing protein [Pseudomonadota bacterium]MDQ7973958.1 DUF2141 domain-containing protein [Rhodocyclaceae bacterium]MDQ7998872.1 DUF2141 domain-containing protein [Pseudomonadota bacterium]MDQ8017022.1 DUF2141 domain-containing protein [Pseudomonadota bacterium]